MVVNVINKSENKMLCNDKEWCAQLIFKELLYKCCSIKNTQNTLAVWITL